MKTITLLLFASLVFVFFVAGCGFSSKSGRGFVFPEGDSARGKQAFVDMKCYRCHLVDGIADLPAPVKSPDKVLLLGGKVGRVRTYGDLVTAVIHPSYSLSDKLVGAAREGMTVSPMKPVNDTMTVQQLLDIVTFLHPRYKGLEPASSQHYQVP